MIQFNGLLAAFLALTFLQLIFFLRIEQMNRNHLRKHGQQVPVVFAGFIDSRKLAQMAAYSWDKSRFSSLHHFFSELLLLTLLLSGFLPGIDDWISAWGFPSMVSGFIFLLMLTILSSLSALPFAYYQTFVLEEKYGFNRSSLRTWIGDHIKSALLSLVLFALILSLVLWMIHLSPRFWWLWGFFLLSAIQILLTVLYPILIAPLFNKFQPLQDQSLAEKITRLVEGAGLHLKEILQMDAGRRSGHTNAYFTGLGTSKRVVLFDTLIQTHPQEEILAVLAHELGHFKKKHILKQLGLMEFSLLAGLYLTSLLLDWPLLYETFGFKAALPYVGLFLIGVLGSKTGFFLVPLSMALSRRYERQADRFALDLLKSPENLVSVFKRMAADNLSNLFPHPFYVWFHYSHPPLAERIAVLENHAKSLFLSADSSRPGLTRSI